MTKRLLALVLAVIMIAAFFAGCGQTADTAKDATTAADASAPAGSPADQTASGSGQTASAAPQEVTYPLTKEKVELSLWFTLPPFMNQYLKDMNENEVFQKVEEKTNVHIKFMPQSPESQRETYNLFVASGDMPDIISSGASFYTGGADKAVNDGVLLRLNELVEKSAPNYMKVLNSSKENKNFASTDEGNIVVFYSFDKGEAPANYGPQIRKDWLDELGLLIPKTYDDYYNVLKAFKEKKNTEPLFIMAACAPQYSFLSAGYGVAAYMVSDFFPIEPFYQEDGKVKFSFIEPGYKDYITMLNKWYSEGLIYKEGIMKQIGSMTPEFQQPIIKGKVGLWYSDTQWISGYKRLAEDPNFHAVAIADAVKNTGDKLHIGPVLPFSSEIRFSGGMNVAISANCKNPEIAVKWLDYWYTDEGSLLGNYGIEGKSYTMVDGKPKLTELITKNDQGMDIMAAMIRYCNQISPYISDPTKMMAGYTEEEAAAGDIWKENCDGRNMIGDGNFNTIDFAQLNAEEASQYANIMGDIKTYSSEMILKFVTGKEPLSNFDAFVAKLKELKVEETIKLKQAAYDRFMSR